MFLLTTSWNLIRRGLICNLLLFLSVSFVSSQGRMKFIRPLYRALFGSMVGRKVATDTFDKYKHRCVPFLLIVVALESSHYFTWITTTIIVLFLFRCRYHPIARKMVSGDFKSTTHPKTSNNIVATAAKFFFQRTTIFVSVLVAFLVYLFNAAFFNKLTFRGKAVWLY